MFVLAVAVTAFFALRNPVILKMALRNIPRRRAQTVLIVVGLMLATTLFSASFAIGDTFSHSVRVLLVDNFGHVDEVVRSDNREATGLREYIPKETADAIRAALADAPVDGVMPAIGLSAPALSLATERNLPGLVVQGLDFNYAEGFGSYDDADGNSLDLEELAHNELYLSADAADDLGAGPGDDLALFFDQTPVALRVADVFEEGGGSVSFDPLAVMRLADLQSIVGQEGNINIVYISNEGGKVGGERHTQEIIDALEDLQEERELDLDDIKRNGIEQADEVGDQFASIFLVFGTFSIFAGILLIALIFVMLAAERKQELGISRAVGAQRGHIVRLFTFEGAVYSLAAAAIGSLLGIFVGVILVGTMASAFGAVDQLGEFRVVFSFRWQSLVLSYTLGMVVTYLVVALSAMRVSALNIVRAVRDIPEPPREGHRLREAWRSVGAAYMHGLRSLLRLRPHRTLAVLAFGGPLAIARLIWDLFIAGYLMIALGILLTLSGISSEQLNLFSMGLSLMVVGLPLVLNHAVRLPESIAYTLAGVLLLAVWLVPIEWESYGLPRFDSGIDILIISGVALVFGGVWVVMYNSSHLVRAISAVLGRGSTLAPITRTALAYPMAARFRTGMTLAMFSLIVMMLVILGFINDAFVKAYEDTRRYTGGFDISAGTSFTNPINDLAVQIDQSPALDAGEITAIASSSGFPVRIRQQGTDQELRDWFLTGIDPVYAEVNGFGFGLRDERYPDDRAVWMALSAGEEVAVVNSSLVPASADFDQGQGPSLQLEGFQRDDPVLPEVYLEVHDPVEQRSLSLRVIGVIEDQAFFASTVVTGHETLQRLSASPLPFRTHNIALRDPSRAEDIAATLEEEFAENGLQATSLEKSVRELTTLNFAFTKIIQGFMGLGLVVGIAALGIITARSVVERRVQVGILRAIGYRSGMVQLSFMIESSFIALLGIGLGLALAFGLSIDLTSELQETFDAVTYVVPWSSIVPVVVIAYAASLLTTYLPARQASRIYPAEALRYD